MNMKEPVIELTCSYDISAAHKLFNPSWDKDKNEKVYGKCAGTHGHQYRLEITIAGSIPKDSGMVINSFEVDRIVGEKIVRKMDHKYLNEDIEFFRDKVPTAEWISVWIFNELKNSFPKECNLKKVRVTENPTLYAEYNGS